MFSGFQQDIVMVILALINNIKAKKHVTLAPERVHVGITYRLLIYVH